MIALALSMLPGAPPVAQDAPAPKPRAADRWAQLAAELFPLDTWGTGDDQAFVSALLDRMVAAPDDPAAMLRFLRASDRGYFLDDPATFATKLLPLKDHEFTNGYFRRAVFEVLERYFRDRGERQTANTLGLAQGTVTEALLLGPLTYANRQALALPYAPDRAFERGAEYPTPHGTARWQVQKLELARRERAFQPERANTTNFAGAIYYVAVPLRVQKDIELRLFVDVYTARYQIAVNGRVVHDHRPDRVDYPSTLVFPLSLKAGLNVVQFKLPRPAGVELALVDRRGFAPQGVRVDLDALGPLAAAPTRPVAPEPVGFWKTVVAQARRESKNAGLSLLASYVSRHEGLLDEAWWFAKRAYDAEKTPVTTYWFAQTIAAHFGFPESQRQRDARRLYKEAAAKWPSFVPVQLSLAEIEQDNDRPRRAADILQRVLEEVNPRSLRVAFDLADLYQSRGWDHLERRQMAAASRIAPDHPRVVRFAWIEAQDRQDYLAALELATSALARTPGAVGLALRVIEVLERLGRTTEAKERLEALDAQNPADTRCLRAHAAFASRTRDYATALDCYQRLRANRTWRNDGDDLDEKIADTLLRLGRTADGERKLRALLAKSPERHELRRYLAFRKGLKDDFYTAYELALDPILARAPGAAEWPRSDSIVLLDQEVTRILPDGAASTVYHTVRKILTTDGVERYGQASYAGTLLAARTIKADGTVIEPIQAGTSLQMPGTEIGAIQEIKFRIDSQAPEDGRFRGARFYFSDPDRLEPLLISRQVTIVPKSLKLTPRRHLVPKDPVVLDTGDSLVYIFEVDDSAAIDTEEPFLPDIEELLPWVEFSVPPTWDDVYAEYAASAGNESWRKLTHVLRDQAATIVRGAKTKREALQRCFRWVNDSIEEGGFSGGGATATLLQRRGDRARLLYALLVAAGLDVQIVFAGSPPGSLDTFAWDAPTASRYRTPVTRVRLDDGQWFAFTHPSRRIALGYLPAELLGATALVVEPGGMDFVVLPGGDPFQDTPRYAFAGKLDPKGDLTLRATIDFPGALGAVLKEQIERAPAFALRRFAHQQVARAFTGFVLENFDFGDVKASGGPLTLAVTGKVAGFATRNRDKLSVPLPLTALQIGSNFAPTPTRNYDLVSPMSATGIERFTLTLPEGLEVARLPDSLVREHVLGQYQLRAELHDSTVTISRRFRITPGRVRVAYYASLQDFCRAIDDAETQRLILRDRR